MKAITFYILIKSLVIILFRASSQADTKNTVCEKATNIQIYDASFFEEMRQFYAKQKDDTS